MTSVACHLLRLARVSSARVALRLPVAARRRRCLAGVVGVAGIALLLGLRALLLLGLIALRWNTKTPGLRSCDGAFLKMTPPVRMLVIVWR